MTRCLLVIESPVILAVVMELKREGERESGLRSSEDMTNQIARASDNNMKQTRWLPTFCRRVGLDISLHQLFPTQCFPL